MKIILALLLATHAAAAPHVNRCCWRIQRAPTTVETIEGGTGLFLVIGGLITFVAGFFAHAPPRVMVPALGAQLSGTLMGWHSEGAFEKGELYKCVPDKDCLGMSWQDQAAQKP